MAIIDNKFALQDLYIGMKIRDKNQLSNLSDSALVSLPMNPTVYTSELVLFTSIIHVSYMLLN